MGEMINLQTNEMNTNHAEIVRRGWEAVSRQDWETLVRDYDPSMVFVMPGQKDVLRGKKQFENALKGLGALLPPGFDITSIRQIGEQEEVVSIINWTSDKVPEGSQLAVLFRFTEDRIFEERWFIDTEQWKSAF